MNPHEVLVVAHGVRQLEPAGLPDCLEAVLIREEGVGEAAGGGGGLLHHVPGTSRKLDRETAMGISCSARHNSSHLSVVLQFSIEFFCLLSLKSFLVDIDEGRLVVPQSS